MTREFKGPSPEEMGINKKMITITENEPSYEVKMCPHGFQKGSCQECFEKETLCPHGKNAGYCAVCNGKERLALDIKVDAS